MSPTGKIALPGARAMAVIAALAGAAIFLPALVGLAWHLAFGPDARYRGMSIPVPAGWFPMRHGESLALERMLHLPLLQGTPTVVFLPMHVSRNLPFDAGIWTRVQTAIQSERGYGFTSESRIVVRGEAGYCWEFTERKDTSLLWITCLVPTEDLSADFSGRREYSGDFYSMLSHLR